MSSIQDYRSNLKLLILARVLATYCVAANADSDVLLSGVALGADRATIQRSPWILAAQKDGSAQPGSLSQLTQDVPILESDTNAALTARLRYSTSNRLEAIGVSIVGPTAQQQLQRWESVLMSLYGNPLPLSTGQSVFCHDKDIEVSIGGVSDEAFLAATPTSGSRCAGAPASRGFAPVFYHAVKGVDPQDQVVRARFQTAGKDAKTAISEEEIESLTMWVGGRWIRLDLVLRESGTAPINGKFTMRSTQVNCSAPLTQTGLSASGDIVLRRSAGIGNCSTNCEIHVDANQMALKEMCGGRLIRKDPIPASLKQRDALKTYIAMEVRRLTELAEVERKLAAEKAEKARQAAIAAMQLPPYTNAGSVVTRSAKQLKVAMRDIDDLGVLIAIEPNDHVEQLAAAEWTADAVGSTEEDIGDRLPVGESRIVFFLHNKRMMGNASRWNFRVTLKDEKGTVWSHAGGGPPESVGIRFWQAFSVVKSSDGNLQVREATPQLVAQVESEMRNINDSMIRTHGEETTAAAAAMRFFWRAMEPSDEVVVVRRRGWF